jgi:hypothetical protein
VGQGAADVVDEEVLLPQFRDLGMQLGVPPAGLGLAAVGQEEGTAGFLAEAVDQNAEAAGAVAEASGGLVRGKALDEEGPEGLVLAVGGVLGLEEAFPEHYRIGRVI